MGVALGDAVVMRMRLGNKEKMNKAVGLALGDGDMLRMLLGNKI